MNKSTDSTRPVVPTPCPCCGQTTEAKLPVLHERTVSFGKWEANLTPQQSMVLRLLLKSYPAATRWESMILELWQQRDEPNWAKQIVQVQVNKLRRKLKPMGFGISSVVLYGYRLERLS